MCFTEHWFLEVLEAIIIYLSCCVEIRLEILYQTSQQGFFIEDVSSHEHLDLYNGVKHVAFFKCS